MRAANTPESAKSQVTMKYMYLPKDVITACDCAQGCGGTSAAGHSREVFYRSAIDAAKRHQRGVLLLMAIFKSYQLVAAYNLHVVR